MLFLVRVTVSLERLLCSLSHFSPSHPGDPGTDHLWQRGLFPLPILTGVVLLLSFANLQLVVHGDFVWSCAVTRFCNFNTSP